MGRLLFSFGGAGKAVKTHVLVLVPYEVPGSDLGDALMSRLEQHRRVESDESPRLSRFDYLVGAFGKTLNDPIAEGRLPEQERSAWSGNVCDKSRVPLDFVPGALVTLGGAWHDLSDFGWRMVDGASAANQNSLARWSAHYRALLAAAPECWGLEVWAHS
ncbi:MAG TPA: hypothetical protein VGM98_25890 [Schlesneria sp.]